MRQCFQFIQISHSLHNDYVTLIMVNIEKTFLM